MNQENLNTEEAVAIIGMAARLPGASSVAEYWDNLKNGVESITFWTDEELVAAGVDPDRITHPNYVKAKGNIPEPFHFDAGFFGFNPREADVLDPQHRVFLECSWHAFEDAGYDPARCNHRVGVWAGTGTTQYLFQLDGNPDVQKFASSLSIVTGNDKDYIATRVSYKLNLRGPSVNVQSACSTSLVAVSTAVHSILNYECDMALAGGVSLRIPEVSGYWYQEGSIVSPDGHCRTFDADSKGTIFSAGCGVVLLKRLSDAIRDRDHIYAVIRGAAVNNDGQMKIGYTAPSVDGQMEVAAEAIAMSGIDPQTIRYFEAHGTATELGDPIEVNALTKVFRTYTDQKQYCAIGSVKTNIGHTDIAAGAAGLIKTALSLEHDLIPASLHYKAPNPEIDFANSPFFVNTELSHYPKTDHPRRAGVNSFGVGGTNAQAILEQAPDAPETDGSRPYQLLLLSTRSEASLEKATDNLAAHLKANPDLALADAAFTLQNGRRELAFRRAVLSSSRDEAIEALETREASSTITNVWAPENAPVTFLFSGQGSQYVNMGKDLYDNEPLFRETVGHCAGVLQPELGFDLRDILYPSADEEAASSAKLGQTQFTQPALFVIEYATAKLWMSWGIKPESMIGHSVGEYVAACMAGVLSLEDALRLIALRGRLMQSLPSGSMLAILLAKDEVEPLLEGDVDIAALNGPAVTVVSGPTPAIAALQQSLQKKGIGCRLLQTSHAFHSSMMDPILPAFEKAVSEAALNAPTLPYLSNVTGTWITADEATSPAYWSRHLRAAVHFSEAVLELLKNDERVFLEVGPGRALQSAVKQHPNTSSRAVVCSLRHPDDPQSDHAFVLTSLGRLWTSGVVVDWNGFYGEERRARVNLPGYPFERERYYIDAADPVQSKPTAALRKPDMADWFYVPSWKKSPSAKLLRDTTKSDKKDSWLVFADDRGLGAALAAKLQASGETVTTVRRDGLAIAAKETYDKLLKEMQTAGTAPTKIVHLWNVTGQDEALTLDTLDAQQDLSFYSLLALWQSLAQLNLLDPLRVGVFSNGLHDVTGNVADPGKALLLGAARVFPQEYESVECRAVDLDYDGGDITPSLVDTIADEMLAASKDETAIAYRGGVRWSEINEAVRVEQAITATPRLRTNGTYLVTGAFGGIGYVMAEYLAEKYKARLVLVGRRAVPERAEWSAYVDANGEDDATTQRIRQLQFLEELGAEVFAASADTSDYAQMKAVVDAAKERFGKIDGVFHVAGVAGGGIIPLKTRAAAEAVLAPKVRGTLVLDTIFENDTLDFLLLFSSLTGLLGSAGQIDYTAANRFLDAYAKSARAAGRNLIAIDWDAWQEVGMAVEDRSVRPGDDLPPGPKFPHPLIDRSTAGEKERTYVASLGAKSHWPVGDHLVTGIPTLVGTGYLEIARAASAERAAGRDIEIRDAYFMAPFMVPNGDRKKLELTIKPGLDADDFTFRSASGAYGEAQVAQEHMMGRIRFAEPQAAVQHDLAAIVARCPRIDEQSFGSEGSDLASGVVEVKARWKNAVRVNVGTGEAIAELRLGDEFAHDLEGFSLHPALLDVATAYAMAYIARPGVAFLPFFYKRLTIKAPMTQRVFAHARFSTVDEPNREMLPLDIVVMDENGRELLEIEQYTLRRVPEEFMNRAADATPGAKSESKAKRKLYVGLKNAEGAEVIERVLAAPLGAQVLVVTRDLEALFDTVRPKKNAMASAALNAPSAKKATHARPNLKTAYAEPTNEIEESVADIWASVIGIEKVGINDGFVELGGHSLLAIQLMSRVRETFQVELPLDSLYKAPTVAGMAEAIIVKLTEATDDETLAAMLAELEGEEAVV